MQGKEIYVDNEHFKLGFYALDDQTRAPYGTARQMENIRVTDRGGLAPRLGTQLVGTINASTKPVTGFYNYKKSFGADEILMKVYDTFLEYISLSNVSKGWARLITTLATGQEMGFVTSLVNTDNEDYLVFGNRYQNYSRWRGALTYLVGALVGGETALTVFTTLAADIFDTQTATGSSSTTLSVSSAPWAASQWNNMYVHITSGAQNGKVRQITATTSTQITFNALGGDPGLCTFEIRKAIFPASGSVIYGGNTVAYTAIDADNKLTVASATAAADGTLVAVIPDTYPQNPRGNRFTNYLNRIIVGNVRSALARDSGGALQGFSSAGSYFVSKVNNPFDFTFSATRVAGEGDIVSTPYGGGNINDVVNFEDSAYIFKNRYIESVQYSQDINDLATRVPLKSGVGSIGRVIKGSDDVYFMTDDSRFVSLSRVKTKDIKPETENLGFVIKRFLESCVFGSGFGIEHRDRIYIPCKSGSTQTTNDIIIVYNKINKAFEGTWTIGAVGLELWNGLLHYAESNGSNVYQMLTGNADVVGTDRYAIAAKYATNFAGLATIYPSTRRIRRSHSQMNQLSSLYFEGYIKGNSKITFKCWKDFSDTEFLNFDFQGTEEALLDGMVQNASLGGNPIDLRPMGSVSTLNPDGYRHFQFRVYFPFQYAKHFSVGFQSSDVDADYELIRLGMLLAEVESVDTGKIKSI